MHIVFQIEIDKQLHDKYLKKISISSVYYIVCIV